MVQVKISETGKIEQLCISRDGIDYAADFIDGRLDGEYNRDGNFTTVSQAEYDWWASVLNVHQHIDDVCHAMIGELPDDVREAVDLTITEAVGNNDLDWFGVAGFDDFVQETLKGHGYKMTIYSDGSIGFDKIA